MSVQSGIVSFQERPLEMALIDKLRSSLEEFIVDGEGTHQGFCLQMLYLPFNTTPDATLDRQPYYSSMGHIIMWDGRLDNREELLSQLHMSRGHEPSDVAIAAAAFERWGRECFPKLTGDWTMTIWISDEKELILARDYIGVRTLFYLATEQGVVWSSSLKPLVSISRSLTVNEAYVAGFLTSNPAPDSTPYNEIKSVPPASYVRFKNRCETAYRYWALKDRERLLNSDREYEEEFLYLLKLSVKRRLRSNSTVLAELSGGLDSSSIVCVCDELFATGACTSAIDTFSFWDRCEPDDEDRQYFDIIEKKRGRIGHHAELVGGGDSFVFQNSEFSPEPGFGVRQELKAARTSIIEKQYRVVFSGFGGDELLGQAMDPRVQLADLVARLEIKSLAGELLAWSVMLRRPLLHLAAQALSQLLPLQVRTAIHSRNKLANWIDKSFARRHRISEASIEPVAMPWFCLPSRRDSMQTYASLAQQLTHRAPCAYETRYPYLDRDLLEFLMGIPREQLLRPNDRRSLMRRALKELVPDPVLSRRTKAGVSRSVAITLQKHWTYIEQLLSSPLVQQFGYIDGAALRVAIAATKSGKTNPYLSPLLRALALEVWLRAAINSGVLMPPTELRYLPEGSHSTSRSEWTEHGGHPFLEF